MNPETIDCQLAEIEMPTREPDNVAEKLSESLVARRGPGLPDRNILLLSTSLLVDRVFRYGGLIDRLQLHMQNKGSVEIWNSSADAEEGSKRSEVTVRCFPEVRPFRELRHNFPRRLNEFVWDCRYRLPSRESMMKHRRNIQHTLAIRALKLPARVLAAFRAEITLENLIERSLLAYPRSEEATKRLQTKRPDVLLSTGPFQFEQPAVVSAAKSLDIPVIAYIPSWDNITTKNRMVFKYDAYIVWNEQSKRELHEYYPHTKNVPVYVVGAPQFDVLKQERFFQTKEEFCKEQGLDPGIPIIVYAIGSPNFLNEHPGAEYLAKRIVEGALGKVQMLVRPHPIHDNAEMQTLFSPYEPLVKLQVSKNAGKELNKRSQDEGQVIEWINTYRHADVVVNLSSTVVIDAAIFDTPVVNLDFDPQPSQSDQQLIKEINHTWPHFKPVAESGGVWLVNDFEELISAVETYLLKPELHRNERKWIVDHVCGYSDANCGERMADAIVSFINNTIAGSNRTNDIK
ncbi:MAG: CDP-glycerol glycerophosphotransferase family protein [Pyrinomonadaceae bacterium]|nr:CDP-glycerol glycerophosphotransferase family protein [Pyrinomonadaceae bacterium]